MKKKLLAALLVTTSVLTMFGQGIYAQSNRLSLQEDANRTKKEIAKSVSGNPMLGFDENGDVLYGGDPSILVDGDTVYCYVGHDASTNEGYYMPDWRCYSSKDMVNWTYEGIAMVQNTDTVTWARDDYEAWAGQVVKYKDKYYFYYCTEANSANGGGKAIGVAVSESPKGPFKDIGKPLVKNSQTPNGPHTWEDIDPTAWIETDEYGVEHRYVGWGNSRFFVCEMEEDMVTIMDRDGDPDKLSCGYASAGDYDIVVGRMNNFTEDNNVFWGETYNGDKLGGTQQYTEAPYYYRQQDEKGNYFGPYYMFFAYSWRECMAYATTDDIMSNEWTFGGVLMEPSATANTNHMAVFDFKGHTYFVYHDGSLPMGSGFRRVACCEEITINEDGTIDPIKMTATGLRGTASTITDYRGKYLTHETFKNTLADKDYPIYGKEVYAEYNADPLSMEWEVVKSLVDVTTKSDVKETVSLESNDKPGLHLSVEEIDGKKQVVLSQYSAEKGSIANMVKNGKLTTADFAAEQKTFTTYEALNGDKDGVSFESVAYPGYFLVSNAAGEISVSNTPDSDKATFKIHNESGKQIKRASVLKTKRMYPQGTQISAKDLEKDIRVLLILNDQSTVKIDKFTTNASSINMNKTGTQTLKVTYKYAGKKYTDDIKITIVEADYYK